MRGFSGVVIAIFAPFRGPMTRGRGNVVLAATRKMCTGQRCWTEEFTCCLIGVLFENMVVDHHRRRRRRHHHHHHHSSSTSSSSSLFKEVLLGVIKAKNQTPIVCRRLLVGDFAS